MIFDFEIPGSWIAMENKDSESNLSRQIFTLVEHYETTNTAFILFNNSPRSVPDETFSLKSWEKRTNRIYEIIHELENHAEKPVTHETRMEIHRQASIAEKIEGWNSTGYSESLTRNIVFINARAFLFSIDNFSKQLAVLCKEQAAPATLIKAQTKLMEYFPNLSGVRNSAHHMEDRMRGKKTGDENIDVRPFTSSSSRSEGENLFLGNLAGSLLGYTMANGRHGEIDISQQSMEKLREVLLMVFNCFTWIGQRQHHPSS